MSLFYLLLVAVIQGITEFLPISSSGHLIVLPALTGYQDQGLTIDIAVHVGTLFAVVLYFWAEVRRAAIGAVHVVRGSAKTAEARLAIALIVATIPAVIVGGILSVTGAGDMLRSAAVVGWTMILFGFLLYWADKRSPQIKPDTDWTLRDAVKMGLWQCLALIPGTSRSGITITGGRLLGYDRTGAARLSMLMSIPIILASGVILGFDVAGEADWTLGWFALIAAIFAFAAALAALAIMFRLIHSFSFTPYVIYRVLFGIGLLVWAYS